MQPDVIGLNGFRARITLLTHPDVPSAKKCSGFDGSVRWVGVTCDTTYEINSAGPFVHRRIFFKSTLAWFCERLAPADPDNPSGLGCGDYARRAATDLSDGKLVGCLRRLFSQKTIRGCVLGPTNPAGLTVLRDETFNMRGIDDGVRRRKKYWNGLQREPTMKYLLQPDGSFDFSLSNSPESQHIYMVDIFSYGLGGLESSLPDIVDVSASKMSGLNVDTQKPAKRVKMEDSAMSGTSSEVPREPTFTNPMHEDGNRGICKITTTMKLYYRQA